VRDDGISVCVYQDVEPSRDFDQNLWNILEDNIKWKEQIKVFEVTANVKLMDYERVQKKIRT
jgi:hypothetical protein